MMMPLLLLPSSQNLFPEPKKKLLVASWDMVPRVSWVDGERLAYRSIRCWMDGCLARFLHRCIPPTDGPPALLDPVVTANPLQGLAMVFDQKRKFNPSRCESPHILL